MFTKNFDNLMLTMSCGQITASGQNSTPVESDWLNLNNTVCKNTSGLYYKYAIFKPYSSGSSYYTMDGILYQNSVTIGEQLTTEQDSDFSAESYFDWKLQHPLNWSMVGSMTKSVTEENGVKYLNIKKTYNNTSGVTKYVREIGITAIEFYASASSSSSYNLLVYRKLLPAPVEVEANANYEVNLKIAITDFRPNKPSA